MMTRAGCSNKTKTKNGLLHTRNTYQEAVKKDIKQSKTVTERNIRSNLSKGEKIALKDLTKRDDIIITNTDKGGTVVIMDVNDYIREILHISKTSQRRQPKSSCGKFNKFSHC